MKTLAREHGFTFPTCSTKLKPSPAPTVPQALPDFFGFNRDLELQYRGRLTCADARNLETRELVDAMRQIATTGKVANQVASIGCSLGGKRAETSNINARCPAGCSTRCWQGAA